MTAAELANADEMLAPPEWSQSQQALLDQAQRLPANAPTTTLAVTSVRWGVTVNLGNFSSARLDAEAAVATGGSAESTLESLKAWVELHSPPSDRSISDTLREANHYRDDLRDLKQRMAEAEAIWERIKRVFVALNIDIPKQFSEDLPF